MSVAADADPVVVHPQLQVIAADDHHPAVAGTSVADHVGQRLADDPIGGQLDLGGKTVEMDGSLHLDGEDTA